jgi:hypothetical protein
LDRPAIVRETPSTVADGAMNSVIRAKRGKISGGKVPPRRQRNAVLRA